MALLETAQFGQILRAPENLAPDVADGTGKFGRPGGGRSYSTITSTRWTMLLPIPR